MPTRVFLMRHGESADPTVFHGAESDVDLSDKGRRQAEVIAEVFRPKQPDLVVASAMRRARATALPLARALDLELHIEPDLHERRVGILSGQPFRDDPIWPETLKRWSSGDTAYAHEGAESYDDIQRRILPVWNRLTADHAGRSLVVVAHGIVCRILLLSILPGWTPSDWGRLGPTYNVGVSELVHDEAGWRALAINQQPDEIIRLGLR